MRYFAIICLALAASFFAVLKAQAFDYSRSVPDQIQDATNSVIARQDRMIHGVYAAPRGSHPGESTILRTKLANIFAGHPASADNGYPRVALTVLKWTPFGPMRVDAFRGEFYIDHDDCWDYKAMLWTSPTQHEEIPRFSVCLGDYKSGVPIDGVSKWAVWSKIGWDDTGHDRTIGPRPPQMPVPRSPYLGLDMTIGRRETVNIANLLMQLGFDWSNPSDGRVWIVGFGAKTPQVQSGESELDKEQDKVNAGWAKIDRESAREDAALKAEQAAQAARNALPKSDGKVHEMAVDDFLLDQKKLAGQTVKVHGILSCVGVSCIASMPGNETATVNLKIDSAPRDQAKAVMTRCPFGTGCKGSVTGTVDQYGYVHATELVIDGPAPSDHRKTPRN